MTNNHKLQIMLTALGYDTYGIDGAIGTNTTNAICDFQSDYDLDVDGIAGRNTMAALSDAFAENDLHVTGAVLQGLLHAAGFNPGTIDGVVGRNTTNALIEFQNYYELDATGELDDDTLQALKDAFFQA